MKNRKLKSTLSVVLIFTLLLGSIVAGIGYIYASETIKIRVLEITDKKQGDNEQERIQSELTDLVGDNKYSIETISMKKFVALREELDGKYDVIYIGSGTYSPDPVGVYTGKSKDAKERAHNTKDKMNDITNLKAMEIKKDFIAKGQLVILHTDILQQNNSKLQNNFKEYKEAASVDNVKFVTSKEQAISAIRSAEIKRPRIKITNQPSNYDSVSSQIYKPGDTVAFDFNITNYAQLTSKNLVANLYIDTDFNRRYDAVEMMGTAELRGSSGKLTYPLTRGYSGMRYWKLEIVDKDSGLKDYATGVFQFRDKKVEVKVLQVTQDTRTTSSLRKEGNMKQSYLETQDYKIDIHVISMQEFNSAEYKVLNGKYNMLIFGFADSYNNAAIDPQAALAVKDFINTGQGVMFTHDTIFETNNEWVKNFMDITGQKAPQTDLGYGAPKTSTKTKKVNEGMMNQFPFLLDNNVTIAATHNQYYTLDLEDENVVPWYNIFGGNRDTDDSWNHYYTYSKGTVTYSGTGHTNTGFPDSEQQLFVNTMYRAFIGANHAPEVTVYTPKEQDRIRTIDPIDIVYKIEDLDLKDVDVYTKVSIKEVPLKDKGKEQSIPFRSIYPAQSNGGEKEGWQKLRNGSLVTIPSYTMSNDMKDGGTVFVEVEAQDKQGAQTKKTIEVEVKRVIAKLKFDRPETIVAEKDKEITIPYRVIPEKLPIDLGTKYPHMTVKDIKFKEVFPPGLEVQIPDQAGWIRTGSLETGYTVTGILGEIKYERVQEGSEFVYVVQNPPNAFDIKVIPKNNQKYVLGNSEIEYLDLDNQIVAGKFKPLILDAETIISSLTLRDIELEVGEEATLFPKSDPQHADLRGIQWEWTENVNYASKTEKNDGSVLIKGLAPGTATIKAKIMSGGKEVSATSRVTVLNPLKKLTLTRSLDKNNVRPNEVATITYNLETKGVTEYKGIFPLALPQKNGYTVKNVYDLTEFKLYGNFGVLELSEGTLEQQMRQGYQNSVAVGTWLNMHNGKDELNKIVAPFLESSSNVGKVITIPLFAETKDQGVNFQVKVNKFATFKLVGEGKGEFLGYGVSVPDLSFEETFPIAPNFEIISVPTGWSKDGNIVRGKPTFTLNGDKYTATFEIKVSGTKRGTYALNQSIVSYTGAQSNTLTERFPNLTLTVDVDQVNPDFTWEIIVVGDYAIVTVTPKDSTIFENTEWRSKKTDGVWEDKAFHTGKFVSKTMIVKLLKDQNGMLLDTPIGVWAKTPDVGEKKEENVIHPRKEPGEGEDNLVKYLDASVDVDPITENRENRAVKVSMGYSIKKDELPQDVTLEVMKAQYILVDPSTKAELSTGLFPDGKNSTITLIKTADGESHTYLVRIKLYHKYTIQVPNEDPTKGPTKIVVEAGDDKTLKPFSKLFTEKPIYIKAKANLN